MKKRGSQHHIDGLLALLLFGVFAVCVLAVLLTGARAYRRLTQRDQAAYDRRVCIQYIATRVRQADSLEGVSVEPFGEGEALVLSEDGYLTRVYFHDGYLMELYASAEEDLSPEDGQRIIATGGVELSLENGLLLVEVTDERGLQDSLRLSLRSGEGRQHEKQSAPDSDGADGHAAGFRLGLRPVPPGLRQVGRAVYPSEARDRAVTLCQTAAETVRDCGGIESGLRQLHGDAYEMDGVYCSFYDENWNYLTSSPDCGTGRPAAVYRLEVRPVDSGVDGLDRALVEVLTIEGDESVFALDIAWQGR